MRNFGERQIYPIRTNRARRPSSFLELGASLNGPATKNEVLAALADEELPEDASRRILERASRTEITAVTGFLAQPETPTRNYGELIAALQDRFGR